MNIEMRYNMVLSLCDTEVKQLLGALKYLRHRFNDHCGCGVYSCGCKKEFIDEMISQISGETKVQKQRF